MKNTDPILQSLLKSARQAPPAADREVPFGFSTRVVAQWKSAREKPHSFMEVLQFFSVRALAMAVCIAFASFIFYWQVDSSEWSMAQDFLITPSSLTWEFFL